nr:hypothetical protein [Nonomuraea deserti]
MAETQMTVVLSSHVVSDLTNACDWLVVLNRGQVQISGEVDELLAAHRMLSGPAELADGVVARMPVISDSRSGRQADLLARTGPGTLLRDPRWRLAFVQLSRDLPPVRRVSQIPCGVDRSPQRPVLLQCRRRRVLPDRSRACTYSSLRSRNTCSEP